MRMILIIGSTNNPAVAISSGLYYNFSNIKFNSNNYEKNNGKFKKVNNKVTGNLSTTEFLIDGKSSNVHNLTLTEMNKALNRTANSTNAVSETIDKQKLFKLSSDYWASTGTNGENNYFLATPCLLAPGSGYWNMYFRNDGYIYDSLAFGYLETTYKASVRPVITLCSEVYYDNNQWKIK